MKGLEFVALMERSSKHLPPVPLTADVDLSHCEVCGKPFPCDTRQLVDVIHRLNFQLRDLEGVNA